MNSDGVGKQESRGGYQPCRCDPLYPPPPRLLLPFTYRMVMILQSPDAYLIA